MDKKTYFIRGTITIHYKAGQLTIGVTPCVGFISQGKSQNAIAYPSPETKLEQKDSDDALVIGLNETKSREFDANAIKLYETALLTIAGQQKPVELHIEKDADNLMITGFSYPAP